MKRPLAISLALLAAALSMLCIAPASAASALSNQLYPCVSSDGTSFLLAWTDDRNGVDDDIYGIRLGAGGVVLDTADIAISTAANGQFLPAMAFDGTNYLVVWMDDRNDLGYEDIYGARVSAEGVVLDTAGIAISTAPDKQKSPAVAFDGTNYLVVWTDYRNASGYTSLYGDIYGSRVNVGGAVLDTAGIAISTAAYKQRSPAVAFDGSKYLVIWEDLRGGTAYGDIYGARVSVGGEVLDASGIAICVTPDGQIFPTVESNGSNWLVLWADFRSGSGYNIYGGRVNAEGVVLDGTGTAICTAAYTRRSPALASDGTDYFAVWMDGRSGSGSYDIYGARVSAEGTTLDTSGIAVCTAAEDQKDPALVFGGGRYLVVWHDWRSGFDWDIYAARVDTSGLVLDPGGVTDVVLSSASAIGCGSSVTLSWQTGVYVAVSSFIIQRSDSREGQFVTLNVPVMRRSEFSYSCTDYSVSQGRTYWYRIILEGATGRKVYGPIQVYVERVPITYRAHQSYPNPFNPLCTIRYDIPRAGRVSLQVFDVTGSLVRTLVDAHREPGSYSESWDGRAEDGRVLASGVYFYRLEAGEFVATRKMVLLR